MGDFEDLEITKGCGDAFDELWPEEFDNFWVPLLKTWGLYDPPCMDWDYEKIKNELHDLVFAWRQISTVYCHITGNQLSKSSYYAGTIIDLYEDEIQKAYDEGYKDGTEED